MLELTARVRQAVSSEEEVVAMRKRLARSESFAQSPARRRMTTNSDLRPSSGSDSQHARGKR